jgi:hypothetical protein
LQDAAIDLARDVKQPVRPARQRGQRSELVVFPIFHDDRLAGPGTGDGRCPRRLEIEQIAAIAAGADLAGVIDDEGFAQAALDRHPPRQQPVPPDLLDEPGQAVGIGGQVVALLPFIGLGGLDRTADNAADPIGKPSFQPEIQRQRGERGHDHGRHQGDHRKYPRQPDMQPRSGRLRAPVGDHLGDPAQHQRRNGQDIGKIGDRDQPQRGRGRPGIEQPKCQIGCQRKDRSQDHQGHRQHGLGPPGAPPTAQPVPERLGPRLLHAASAIRSRSGTALFTEHHCCQFTSVCGSVSREFPDR